jgi:TetR/AcrR family transcriptional repressor of mexJK operon
MNASRRGCPAGRRTADARAAGAASRELLNVALDTFLEKGFEQTTMEEIAIRVGMSKRTVYARYEDKDAPVQAAVQRAIERYTVPASEVEALATDDLAKRWLRSHASASPTWRRRSRPSCSAF